MRYALIVTLSLGLSLSARAEILSSAFDASTENWTSSGGTTGFNSTGGNPGGYLTCTDTDVSDQTIFAPSKFLGDLSRFQGGKLSFDARNENGDLADYANFGIVTITGTGGTATFNPAGTGEPTANWKTYSVNLDASLWSGDLAAALANITSISVDLEFHNGVSEVAGFDNFRLETPAVPAPAAAPLLALGFLGLAIRRRVACG